MNWPWGAAFVELYDRYWAANSFRPIPWVVHFYEAQATHGSSHVLLDLCCGTGRHARWFADRGYKVFGVNSSPEMLVVARRNGELHVENGTIRLVHADASCFELDQSVSLSTCLNDSLNHLSGLDALYCCFASVRKATTKDGIFIFDIHTRRGLASMTSSTLHEFEDAFFATQLWWDDDANLLTGRISGFIQTTIGWERFEHLATQRSFAISDVFDCLKAAQWKRCWAATIERLNEPLCDPEQSGRVFLLAIA